VGDLYRPTPTHQAGEMMVTVGEEISEVIVDMHRGLRPE